MAEDNKKKKKLTILIISIAAALVLILAMSLTFAFVFSKKDGGENHPTPSIDDKVTLEWGEHSTVDIDDLLIGEERGPYEIGLMAKRNNSDEFIGKFTISMESETSNSGTYKLIDYIYISVYENSDKTNEIFTINSLDEVKSKSSDIVINNNKEKILYLYIGLSSDLSTYIFEQINDSVNLIFDWGI